VAFFFAIYVFISETFFLPGLGRRLFFAGGNVFFSCRAGRTFISCRGSGFFFLLGRGMQTMAIEIF
jgi:hypothetical protein